MPKKEYKRRLIVFQNHFIEFKKTLPLKTLKKIYQVFLYIMTLDVIPTTYLKSIAGVSGLYEIRIEDDGNIFRIFCCFDDGNLVVLFNGFQKKSQKAPSGEIEKARRLMKKYFDNKKGL